MAAQVYMWEVYAITGLIPFALNKCLSISQGSSNLVIQEYGIPCFFF